MSYQSKAPQVTSDIGDNPRDLAAAQADYRLLRDARSAARADERKQESQESADRIIKVPKEWTDIRNHASRILDDVGQDLEVVLWLIEAETRLSGHAGLASGLQRLAAMVTEHGALLHPHPQHPSDRPFEMIAALNGMGREGTLIQPLRLLPLIDGAPYGTVCLWSTQSGDEATVEAALEQAGAAAAAKKLSDVQAAQEAVADCDQALTDLLGVEAPPFSQIVDVLDETIAALSRLITAVFGESNLVPIKEVTEDTPAAATMAPPTGQIRSREEAFDQLMRIAQYFRQSEPHSPIADTLETVVRRGRMDFLALIEELIPDPNARQAAMTTAGIGKKQTDPPP